MNAVPILLADVVTTVINAAVTAEAFETLGFTARRSYPDWDDDFAGLNNLQVDVVFVGSGGDVLELDSASSIDSDPAVDIAVRKRFQPADRDTTGAVAGRIKSTAIDPLVRLVEQIHEIIAVTRDDATEITTGIYANWLDASVRTYCDFKRLREGVFLGVVRVKFNVSKTV